jgi:acetyl/propionyl-CoA carboxylase alpha subunit
MIAKLIVWDVNRDRALARMLQALADYRVVGVANNVEFLSRLTACPAFANADLDTGLIEREKDYLFPEQAGASREAWLAVALAELLRERERAAQQAARHPEPASPWHQRDGWRLNTDARRSLIFRLGDEQKLLSVESRGNAFAIGLDGVTSLVSGSLNPRGLLRAEFDGLRTTATVVVAGERRHVFGHGRAWQFAAVDPLHHAGEGGGAEGGLLAPMPGKVIALIAEAGATVERARRSDPRGHEDGAHHHRAGRRHRQGLPLRGGRPGGRRHGAGRFRAHAGLSARGFPRLPQPAQTGGSPQDNAGGDTVDEQHPELRPWGIGPGPDRPDHRPLFR